VFDPEGKLTGFRHTWTFDPVYSALAVMGLDSHHSGRPDPDQLAEIARDYIEGLKEWRYFTATKVDGAEVEYDPPAEYSPTYDNGRLTLRFFLPLKVAARTPRVTSLAVEDPSFFVAFNVAEGPDAITLVGPAAGCALNVKRSAGPAKEGVQLLQDAIASALAGKLDGPSPGEDYTTRILVTCS